MRVCWNRQTGTFEGRVFHDVRVQVPSLAVTVISICISEYDGERITVKTKVDRRKQLFLGRALMKV